jgi:hypothetical protein
MAFIFFNLLSSCLAQPNDMDALPITPRSMEHTLEFIQAFELGVAWENYGMVGDVTVRQSFHYRI